MSVPDVTPAVVWTLICVLLGALIALLGAYVWMRGRPGPGPDIEPWISPPPEPLFVPDEWVDV